MKNFPKEKYFLRFGNVQNQRKPVPNTRQNPEEENYSGMIVIRLSQKFAYRDEENLYELARQEGLERLLNILEEYGQVPARKVIKRRLADKVAEWEKIAANSDLPPLRSLTTYWKLDFRAKEYDLQRIEKLLKGVPGVETAYREYEPSLPAVNISDDVHAAAQDYLEAAPTGVDAIWAWTQPDCEGAGTGFIDCEWGWNITHEDLVSLSPTVIFNDNSYGSGGAFGPDWDNHGTAVLGEAMATDNTVGIVGVAPSIDYVKMSSFYDAATDGHADTAEAIAAAIGEANVGDVILLEIQKGFRPTEVDDADFDAIRLAVANGRIVVEAAGNGNNDLDSWTDTGGNFRLNRTHADFQDSGAIMVGASVSAVAAGAHERWAFSNFGSRIDCYAYGENVVTSGYGDLAGTTDDDEYTAAFGGTSAASPIIVGCALIIQGKYKAVNGTILSPLQMRSLLSNPATGTPQGTTVAGFINVMPNLRAIIENTLGLVPDIYFRDNVGDNGAIPSSGGISASPDIIVRPSEVADPVASFGEGSGTENDNTLGFVVEAGQDNFIYTRFKNRGTADAGNATASIYWSEVATLVTPDMWNYIGSTTPVNVPTGNTLVVPDRIVWDRADIPATGHYCFVGLLHSPQDAAPPIPPVAGFDWDDFRSFIRNHNNVTWRNFNVEDNLPDPPGPPAEYKFLITNAPDRQRIFDLEILRVLPADVDLWLEINEELFRCLRGIQYLEVRRSPERGYVQILLPKMRCVRFAGVNLPPKARFASKFLVTGAKSLLRGTHYFGIGQFDEDLEVGRVTWALKPGKKDDQFPFDRG